MSTSDFSAIQARLHEIADEVNDESRSLDEVLALFEEAVKLGTKASDCAEQNITEEELASAQAANAESTDAEQAEAEAGESAERSGDTNAGVPEN